tara:strand:+ start:160 stop:423 length:264 start_codon:yes stop_codon:yes gene_type:complete
MPTDAQLDALVRDFSWVKEKVETMNAERPRALGQAAVRRQDIGELALLAPKSESAAGSTPTQAEYDALVADVHRIMNALRTIGSALL